jgi:hypothetical protein
MKMQIQITRIFGTQQKQFYEGKLQLWVPLLKKKNA